MKKYLTLLASLLTFVFIISGCAPKPVIKEEKIPAKPKITVQQMANEFSKDVESHNLSFRIPYGTRVRTMNIDTTGKKIVIDLSNNFAFMPFRPENVKDIYDAVKNYFGPEFSDYTFVINTLDHPIEDFIPNYFRKDSTKYDYSRIPTKKEVRPAPVVENISKKFIPTEGLFNRNIVVWPSHGWYYNNKEDRWEWQRPRIFQSVEDLVPLSFTVPYLLPMLEKAGAVVFDPRERDIQPHSVVVDNDTRSDVKSKFYVEKNRGRKYKWHSGEGTGFAVGNPPYPSDYNPFEKGTYRETETSLKATSSISWIPNIPVKGKYAVYISYVTTDKSVNDARYTVYHEGIKTEFKVNQQIGGKTWIYLGEFKFGKGFNPDSNKVVLTNESSEPGKIITADAVRFGGGMGIIERGGAASGRPKIFEGARYYLQYAGMPDSLVYNLNDNKNDYNDDYMSRPEYVNYLYGAPFGPNADREAKGLGIPIDISLAFHTDAGITHNDTTVGTLAIYSLRGAKRDSTYPDGVSRFANRDLADIMQTQIVDDIRAEYDPAWNRRQLDNGRYSESFRPNVPAVLIELLSHQNFTDMKFMQDPQFRFTVARAMYKGMLRFLSVQYDFKYVVEPLPVHQFSASMNPGGDVTLKWLPTNDPLEATAKPDAYIVYTRINGGDFDNGVLVDHPYAEFKDIKPGQIYSYKVTAINKGGESFPSEILSVCSMKNDKRPVLIVNGFDRVAAPATVETPKFIGFFNEKDRGVPDKYDLSFTGREYDFDSTSQWITNDRPGWGASYADYETKVIAGNTFDYPYLHGKSIRAAGYPFVSASVQSVINGDVNLNDYKFVDLILGEQKTTHWQRAVEDSLHGLRFKAFPAKLRADISAYCQSGGNIFVSGSYVASDLFEADPADTAGMNFAKDVLKYNLDTDHGAKTGEVFSSDSLFMTKFDKFGFNTALNNKIYAAQTPDAITHTAGSKTILRYTDNSFGAGTAYKEKYGSVVFGFPFETILGQKVRNEVMKAVMDYLGL